MLVIIPYFSVVNPLKNMKKIFFVALTLLCISCETKSKRSEVNKKTPSEELQKSEKLWYTDVDRAIRASKNTGQSIFVFFTGKDWCSWCHKLDRQILSQDDFLSFARENLILLELDFPKERRDLPRQQIELAVKFQIRSYPTVVLMDAYKNEMGRTGYLDMSPKEFADYIKTIIK